MISDFDMETGDMSEKINGDFAIEWAIMQRSVHATACAKGWWDDDRSDAECIALMHSELSEALEALRHGNPPDDKVPSFNGAEAELADVVIRIMDLAGRRGWDIGAALTVKAEFNKTRPTKHGKKF